MRSLRVVRPGCAAVEGREEAALLGTPALPSCPCGAWGAWGAWGAHGHTGHSHLPNAYKQFFHMHMGHYCLPQRAGRRLAG